MKIMLKLNSANPDIFDCYFLERYQICFLLAGQAKAKAQTGNQGLRENLEERFETSSRFLCYSDKFIKKDDVMLKKNV